MCLVLCSDYIIPYIGSALLFYFGFLIGFLIKKLEFLGVRSLSYSIIDNYHSLSNVQHLSGVCIATFHFLAPAKHPSQPAKAGQGDFSRLPDKAAASGGWFVQSPPPGCCWDRIHPQCAPTPPKSAAVRLHHKVLTRTIRIKII